MTVAEPGPGGPDRCRTPEDMTHRMYVRAALLAPSRLYGVEELRAAPTLIPAERGVYGWWFDRPPPDVPIDGTEVASGWRLLYVGVAGRRSDGSRTLRKRLANHVRGPVATSTLRRTLAVLLAEELSLDLARRAAGKMTIGDGEVRLTAWMAKHARVAWVVVAEPRTLELELITDGPRLPLNIEGSADAFAATLRRRRNLAALV